jgi:hypothetical protein
MPLGVSWEGGSKSKMRKSGDRPTTHNELIDFEGGVDGDVFEPTA